MEKLTLTEAELDQSEPVASQGVTILRPFYPFDGSDKQRSFMSKQRRGTSSALAAELRAILPMPIDVELKQRKAATLGCRLR